MPFNPQAPPDPITNPYNPGSLDDIRAMLWRVANSTQPPSPIALVLTQLCDYIKGLETNAIAAALKHDALLKTILTPPPPPPPVEGVPPAPVAVVPGAPALPAPAAPAGKSPQEMQAEFEAQQNTQRAANGTVPPAFMPPQPPTA